jgi:dihydrofolate reductase
MNRKIILGLALSLDGMIEGPNGEYDWCFTDQDYGMQEFLAGVDSVLYGRKSYELLMRDFGKDNPFGQLKSYVFSRTMPPSENYTLVNGDIAKEIDKIRQSPGKNLWLFGGAELTSELLRMKLVDELWLSVHPIILGQGKPLFASLTERVKLELVSSKPYNTGLVSLTYKVVH